MTLITSKIKSGVSDVRIAILYAGTAPVLAGYEYQLKTGDLNPPIDSRQGDNQNSQDDIYALPTPAGQNAGRKAVVTSKIAAMDRDSDYEVRINVLQDGTITDTLISRGKVAANGEAALSFDIIKFI